MLSLLKRLFTWPMKIDAQGGTQCQLYGFEYRPLCKCLGQLPGVVFPRKPPFFWTGSGVYAEFVLRGHTFQIEGDPFDDALWISPKDKLAHPEEVRDIHEHLERFISKTGG